jgi:hypothetical protein
VIAEHRGRRDHDEPRQDSRQEQAPPGRPAISVPGAARGPDSPPPVAEDELVPAETLFAASLIANASRAVAGPAEPPPRATDRGWQPPESPLRLKDKLI